MRLAGDNTRRSWSLVLRTLYALCLLGATYNHWRAIADHGFGWDHGGFPRASTTFWTSLAFIDPAAVILLFVRPNAGVAATVAIIVADVIHNVWIEARYFPPLLHDIGASHRLAEQIVFLVFVVATCPLAWSAKPRRGALRRPRDAVTRR